MLLDQKDLERFWSKVGKKGPDDCWPWLAARSQSGYGRFSIKHKSVDAHRVSFFIKNGYLPDISQRCLVMHDCENPICQNPKHLINGSVKENGNYPGCIAKLKSREGYWKGKFGRKHTARWGKRHSNKTKQVLSEKASKRGGWHKGLKRKQSTKDRISAVTRGENHGASILTEKIVRGILRSDERNAVLARKYGVDPSVISGIKRRVKWKHVRL
jgi:hypothetical protein